MLGEELLEDDVGMLFDELAELNWCCRCELMAAILAAATALVDTLAWLDEELVEVVNEGAVLVEELLLEDDVEVEQSRFWSETLLNKKLPPAAAEDKLLTISTSLFN